MNNIAPISATPEQQAAFNRFTSLSRRAETSPSKTIAARSGWPEPLDEAAYYGLAGEIVKAIEPDTEADSAAILMQVLVYFGALVGRGPHIRVEGDQHHSNIFALLVGGTSKGRKGTSLGRVREIFSVVTNLPSTVTGLSSGEGLKWAVRDPIKKIERDKKTGFSNEVDADPGIADKRLLVVESEFSQVLKQGARAGNTLSPTIRAAWDTGKLSTLTKTDAVTATDAHICMIGHITADELRADLTATDSANGFANRYIFMCTQRSKRLAFGGRPISPAVLADFGSRIAKAAASAQQLKALELTDTARDVWEKVYPVLSEGYTGLIGAVTARAEAQCLRLALLFALMAESPHVDDHHLRAALAVWERAAESAKHIFGSALGDVVADEILRGLNAAGRLGMTRTDIRNQFGRHKSEDRIKAALAMLTERGLAHSATRPTAGRDAEVWFCGQAGATEATYATEGGASVASVASVAG